MDFNVSGIYIEYGDARFGVYSVLKRITGESGYSKVNYLHNHSHYEIHLALRGGYTYKIGGENIRLNEGELLIIPPSVMHESVDTYSDYCCEALPFTLEKVDGYSGFYEYFSRVLSLRSLIPLKYTNSLKQQILKISDISVMDNTIKSYCHSKNEVSKMLFDLFDCLDGYKSYEKIKIPERNAKENLALLETLVNAARPLKEIAEILNYSQRHTARLIKKTYNMSLTELYKKRRKENE